MPILFLGKTNSLSSENGILKERCCTYGVAFSCLYISIAAGSLPMSYLNRRCAPLYKASRAEAGLADCPLDPVMLVSE